MSEFVRYRPAKRIQVCRICQNKIPIGTMVIEFRGMPKVRSAFVHRECLEASIPRVP